MCQWIRFALKSRLVISWGWWNTTQYNQRRSNCVKPKHVGRANVKTGQKRPAKGLIVLLIIPDVSGLKVHGVAFSTDHNNHYI